jgi:uncharacterized phage protein (TIGR01671 family)
VSKENERFKRSVKTMREILFRGKRIDDGEWVEGYLFQAWERTYILWGTTNDVPNMIEVIPETVGQYTGLTDKNGVKVFEGDILKQKTTKEFKKYNFFEWEQYGIVRFGYYDWKEGCHGYATMCWYIEHLKNKPINPDNYCLGHINAGLNQNYLIDECHPFEVIGNIHDNPELLGGDDT